MTSDSRIELSSTTTFVSTSTIIVSMRKEKEKRKTFNVYFEPATAGGFRGRARTTLVTTLDSDLKAVAQLYPARVTIRQLKTLADLTLLKIAAQDRDSWRETILTITEVVQAEALPNSTTNATAP